MDQSLKDQIYQASSLIDSWSNVIKSENFGSRKESLDESFYSKSTNLPKYAPIFERILLSLKLSLDSKEENNSENSEGFSSSSEEEDTDLIRDQLKDENINVRDDKPVKDFRIRNRQSKTSVTKAKIKQRIGENVNVNIR